MSAAPDPLVDALARVTAHDERGAPTPLAPLLAPTALLVFLRHFGCIGCAQQVGDLRPRLGELASLGVRVTLLGCGSPDALRAFIAREHISPPITTLTDPSGLAHDAARLTRSWWGGRGPGAALGYLLARSQGYEQHASLVAASEGEGDRSRQGGALLIDDGRVLYHHRATRLGDLPRLVEIVDLALALVARKSPLGL